MLEAELLADYKLGDGVLAIDKIDFLAEHTMVGL
jgi:hypothetical protein